MARNRKSELILTAERAYQAGAISEHNLDMAYELEARMKRTNRDVWMWGAGFIASLFMVGVSVACLIYLLV